MDKTEKRYCLTREKGKIEIKKDADLDRVKEMLADIQERKEKENLSDYAYIIFLELEYKANIFLKESE